MLKWKVVVAMLTCLKDVDCIELVEWKAVVVPLKR